MLSHETRVKIRELGLPVEQDPTLSNLLAWCGEGFCSLDRVTTGWRAMGRKGKELVFPNLTYQSPEEAVAELGIQLHK